MSETTWRKEITSTMSYKGDDWANVEAMTINQRELDIVFDCGYGSTNGIPFTVWTKDYIYFPACYDGSEWCACVPRNPNGLAIGHIGG